MKTEIINIIDRSGSMASIDRDACGGFNGFIEGQRAVPGEARVTTVLFDNRFETIYQGIPIAKVPKMNSVGPRGMTALLDAIGKTVYEQDARIRSEGWADKVIVCIVTDGGENASHEYTRSAIRDIVQGKQMQGWAFIFLAANQDAFAAADSYGIDRAYTANFTADAAGVRGAYASINATTRALRGTTL